VVWVRVDVAVQDTTVTTGHLQVTFTGTLVITTSNSCTVETDRKNSCHGLKALDVIGTFLAFHCVFMAAGKFFQYLDFAVRATFNVALLLARVQTSITVSSTGELALDARVVKVHDVADGFALVTAIHCLIAYFVAAIVRSEFLEVGRGCGVDNLIGMYFTSIKICI